MEAIDIKYVDISETSILTLCIQRIKLLFTDSRLYIRHSVIKNLKNAKGKMPQHATQGYISNT